MSSTRIKVNQGIVRGCTEKLPDGKSFLRFSGIPYAKPPINELRFRAPQKLLKFDQDEIDCTKEGDPCYHRSSLLNADVGSEDCLYLNVYLPADVDTTKKLPVMVYIHGGGFSSDSGSISWYSPEYLLMENVIVVTMNYRLHVLGFLTLPSMGIYGNAGLKDQQMALEWVHENIASFNGDPNNICLFGESAGAASVHFQVLNSKSRSFIKSAICQSGCALGDWALQMDGVKATRKLAKILGCESDEDKEIYKTLMSASAQTLSKNKTKPQDRDERRRNLIFTFKPVIEVESDEAFMSKSPIELTKAQEGQINIPLMFGTTDIDGIAMVAAYRFVAELFNRDPVMFVPRSLEIDPNCDKALALGHEIKRFYFGSEDVSDETILQFVRQMTDFHFLTPQTISNELNARYQPNCKQYLYEFGFDGELNHYKKLLQMEELSGAGHGDDVCYLFHQRVLGTRIVETDQRTSQMRKLMCKLWTNFAKHHDPTPDHDNPLPLKWNHVLPVVQNIENIDLDYLVINDETKMLRNLNKHRMDFWRDVYKKWNKSFIISKL